MALKPHHGRQGDPVWLPEVLRAFGVTVKEMPGWKNWGMGDFTDTWGIIVHHTAGPNTSAEYIARNPGVGRGLSSQIHLARNGEVTLCGAGIAFHAGLTDQGAKVPDAIKGYVSRKSNGVWQSFTAANARTIGIEAVNAGDGTQDWPDVQMDAYARTCAAICWYLGLPVTRVIGHKEMAPSRKIDPNFDMVAFRRRVQFYVDNPPIVKTPVKEAPVNLVRKIRSLINPTKTFSADVALAYIDAKTYNNEAMLKYLIREQGGDPDKVIADAIAAERKKA